MTQYTATVTVDNVAPTVEVGNDAIDRRGRHLQPGRQPIQ